MRAGQQRADRAANTPSRNSLEFRAIFLLKLIPLHEGTIQQKRRTGTRIDAELPAYPIKLRLYDGNLPGKFEPYDDAGSAVMELVGIGEGEDFTLVIMLHHSAPEDGQTEDAVNRFVAEYRSGVGAGKNGHIHIVELKRSDLRFAD